jgi:hypothetical protein
MSTDEERLKQIYESWKTEDLMKAVTVDKTKYESFAIDLMNREMQKRNVKKEEIAKFEKEFLEKEERLSVTGSLFCPHCLSTNVKELFTMFSLKYFLLGRFFALTNPKYKCLECGYHFSKSREKFP